MGLGSFSQQITAGANDVSMNGGAFADTGNVNRFGQSGGTVYQSCWHFTNVTIPKNATILSAKLTFQASNNDAGACSPTVYCEAADDPTAPTSAGDFTGRVMTTGTAWDPVEDWTAGNNYESEDFASELQEVVNRAGWVDGNDINVFIKGDAGDATRRQADSFEGDAPNAVQIDVSYSVFVPRASVI